MYLTIITLPLFGAITAGFLGRKLGITGSQIITSASIFISCILSITAFYEVALRNSPVSIKLASWIDSELVTVDWGFNFDALSVSMLLPVIIVSALVHIYSIGYMSEDPHQQRFFSYLSLFTFFMLILITGDNYLVMFIGWEGVGVCSYLLISFWFTRIQANKSAIAAILYNRVGDMFLTIGLFGLIFTLGNLDYSIVFSTASYLNINIITIIGICFLLGAMAKSAQIGLHLWLPTSMEGPTPVSALIHAATMVTAGVYLLMRSSPLLEYSPTVLLLVLWVGAITTLFAGTVGLFQNDLKKIIAFSTCSQLGMLFIAVGLSQYNVALFHLINHAFFKALLFLSAGSIIHAMSDEQDIRKLGGLVNILPFSYTMILIGSLSLTAMPFLTGFYSKDLIIELAYGQYEFTGRIIYWISVISAVFTMSYSIRLLYLTFLSSANGSKKIYSSSHEGPFTMSISLIILAIMSIIFGYYFKDFFVGIGSNGLSHSLFVHPNHIILVETEFHVPTFYKLLPLVASLIVAIMIILIYQLEILSKILLTITKTKLGLSIYAFFNQKYWLDLLYNKYFAGNGLALGYTLNKQLDRGSIELIGPYGIVTGFSSLSKIIAKLDTGIITNYALYILIGLISFISIVFISSLNNGNLSDSETILTSNYTQLVLIFVLALTI